MVEIKKMNNVFVINRLKNKPITYSVDITHYVSGGEWMMSSQFNDVDMEDNESKERVISDLERIIELIKEEIDNNKSI